MTSEQERDNLQYAETEALLLPSELALTEYEAWQPTNKASDVIKINNRM